MGTNPNDPGDQARADTYPGNQTTSSVAVTAVRYIIGVPFFIVFFLIIAVLWLFAGIVIWTTFLLNLAFEAFANWFTKGKEK